MTIVRSIVRLLICGCVLASCCREKYYNYYVYNGDSGASVTVRFNWSSHPDARPSSMSVMVFGAEGQPMQFPLAGRYGGSIVVTSGPYAFLAFNDDTDNIYSDGDSWNTFTMHSREANLASFSSMFAQTRDVPRAAQTEDQPMILEPDPLWTSACGVTDIEPCVPNLVAMTMRSAVYEYVFRISGVDNLSYVSELVATISGMSDGWTPSSQTSTDAECIIPFVLSPDGGSAVTGRVRTFGHCPGRHADHARHMLVLYALMKDGSRYYQTFDVTEAMHEGGHQSDGNADTTVPIVLENVPLPQPAVSTDGMHPVVGDWQEVHVPLPL